MIPLASTASNLPPPPLAPLWQYLAFWLLAATGAVGFAASYLYTTGLWELLLRNGEPAWYLAKGFTRAQTIDYLGAQFWSTNGCLVAILAWLGLLFHLGQKLWSSPGPAGPSRAARISVGASILGLFIGFCLSWGFELDDKWITYRTSLNILATGLPVWNLGEKVNLSTSFVWPYLCTLGHLLGNWNTVVKIIGFLFVLGTAGVTWRLIPHRTYALIGACGVTLFYPLVLWSLGGLETSLATFYLSLCVLLFLRSEGRSLTALALMGAVMFVRPDLVLVGAGVLTLMLLTGDSLRFMIKAVVAYALPIGVFLLFHQTVFGVPFPRPFYMKGLRKTSSPDFGTINEIFTGSIHLNAALTLFLLALAVFVVVLLTHLRARRSPSLAIWGAGLGLFLHLGYTHVCGYQHMAFGFRYYVPTVVTGFLLLLFCQAKLRENLSGSRFEYGFLLTLLALQSGLFVFTARQGQTKTMSMTRCILRDTFSLNAYAGWMKSWIDSGRYLAGIAKPDETLFTWANLVAPSVSTVYAIDQFYMPQALSTRPEIAGSSDKLETYTYILTSPDEAAALSARFPHHYILKEYPNLCILRQKADK